ncbi:hypothetical protein [Ruminococcus sp.]|uniref:hypothetical protein n=1 Tax=Ruminococcus sp. TaxID=41978 RepID=UPI001B1E732B|nr:hypothetical protein [Ruminococcus sp.]MBO5558607.1 hypothetical protein [Ruminococcus sp.]
MALSNEPFMLDGDSMINKNYHRHDLLNGAWVTLKSDFSLYISGFDYTMRAYDKGELTARFRFDTEGTPSEFPLCIMGTEKITDHSGKPLFILNDMHFSNGTITARISRLPENSPITIELVRASNVQE